MQMFILYGNRCRGVRMGFLLPKPVPGTHYFLLKIIGWVPYSLSAVNQDPQNRIKVSSGYQASPSPPEHVNVAALIVVDPA